MRFLNLGVRSPCPCVRHVARIAGARKVVGAVGATDLGKGPFLFPDGVGRHGLRQVLGLVSILPVFSALFPLSLFCDGVMERLGENHGNERL
jgi:hypothetical protein